MKKEYLIIIIIVLVSIASFGLGRMSVTNSPKDSEPVEFIVPELTKIDMNFSGYSYVASINGTKYYPRGCKSVNRIKQENRVYFKSASDAQKSGYGVNNSC